MRDTISMLLHKVRRDESKYTFNISSMSDNVKRFDAAAPTASSKKESEKITKLQHK